MRTQSDAITLEFISSTFLGEDSRVLLSLEKGKKGGGGGAEVGENEGTVLGCCHGCFI